MEQEIIKIFNKVSSIFSTIGILITNTIGEQWILFLGYLILNVFDYITGTIKAKVKKEESSSKGLLGIVKKLCYWILIALSFLISFLLTKIGKSIDINLNFIMLFGWFTLACLIINETRSILENLIDVGIKVPNFLAKGLDTYDKLIESKTNENDEN